MLRNSHEHLVDRAWALRSALTAYDAMYVALAETLEATIVTCDGRLGRGHGVEVEVVG